MCCIYDSINRFTEHFRIEYQNQEYKAEVSIYSLTKTQKAVAITVCALAAIALVVGVASLLGGNFLTDKGAWAMVGISATVGTGVVAGVGINHLVLVRKVGQWLPQNPEDDFSDWNKATDYPLPYQPAVYSFDENEAPFEALLQYVQIDDNDERHFHIEIHRTKQIMEERKASLQADYSD